MDEKNYEVWIRGQNWPIKVIGNSHQVDKVNNNLQIFLTNKTSTKMELAAEFNFSVWRWYTPKVVEKK